MKKLIVLYLALLGFPSWAQQVEPLIFREKTHDFGDIEEGKGNADHEFVFTNNSGREVRIVSVQASCGCTTPDWSKNPTPQGKTGFIKASFDPRGRPGYFNKSLTVTTDLDANAIVLQVKGQVVTPGTIENTDFSAAQGNLHFKSKSFSMGTVFINKDAVQRQFPVRNEGTAPIKFLTKSHPSYVKIEMPSELAPQERGVIKISYDARQKNQFGFASDNVQITTDDAEAEVKSISIFATLEEYYPTPTVEEAMKGPILFIKEQDIDLGRFRLGAVDRAVMVKNTGKKDLLIKALQGNCVCIAAQADKRIVSPGDSTSITISFSPQSRGGTQQKAITVYSNDPRQPVQRIMVQAYIED